MDVQPGDILYCFEIIRIYKSQSRYQTETFAECKCKCGKIVHKILYYIKIGRIQSCGCYHREMSAKRMTKYNKDNAYKLGQLSPRLYACYNSMKNRCYNSKNKGFHRYGLRGITVCSEWLDDYANFYNWSINNGYSDKLTLDRKDNDGNYCPENCRWANQTEQCNNTSKNVSVEAFQETKTLSDWSRDERCVVTYEVFRRRIKRGWDTKSALTTPVRCKLK